VNPLRQSRNAAAAFGLAVVLMSSCAHAGKPGVAVSKLDADLVFGAKEPDTKPANVLGGTNGSLLGGGQLTGDLTIPAQDFPTTPAFRGPRPALYTPQAACPDAALNAFPAESAPTTPPNDRRPATGSYRWKKNGSIKDSTTAGTSIAVHGFEQRLVDKVVERGASTNVSNPPPSPNAPGVIFQFDAVQPDLQGNAITTTWQVNTQPAQASQYVNGSNVAAHGGEPERGVVIKQIVKKDRLGNTVSTFAPATGLLILPLPVTQGETFQSVATDPRTGLEYSYNAQVLPRFRVDACGTILDSWLIHGTMTIAGRTQSTYTYDVGIATQMGGIPIYEKIVEDDGNGKIDLTESIGQQSPEKAGT
jgi:hypothetical protein